MMKHLTILAATALLGGCAADIAEIGKEPAMSPVGSGAPAATASAYNYPEAPRTPQARRFSLWNDRQSRLFTDPRALQPGDILTVKIEIKDRAKLKNDTDRTRKADKSLNIGLSGDWNGASAETNGKGSFGSSTSHSGTGATDRSEDIALSVAAVVTEVMPNGNMVIQGSQEVRVNAELRVLTIAGIVRPSDIGPQNTISYERIAEARISYGGRGRLSEVQQPPYGQQFLDKVLPF